MRLIKQLGFAALSASLMLVGGAMMLTAVGGVAMAVDHAPEIDPSTITSAASLFFGSVLLLTGRRVIK